MAEPELRQTETRMGGILHGQRGVHMNSQRKPAGLPEVSRQERIPHCLRPPLPARLIWGPTVVRDRYTLSFYRYWYTRKAGGNSGKGHLCLNVFPLSPQEGSVVTSKEAPDTAHLRIFLSSV